MSSAQRSQTSRGWCDTNAFGQRYYSLAEIVSAPGRAGILSISESTWLRGVTDGIYPAKVKLSAKSVAWWGPDINKALEDLNKPQ